MRSNKALSLTKAGLVYTKLLSVPPSSTLYTRAPLLPHACAPAGGKNAWQNRLVLFGAWLRGLQRAILQRGVLVRVGNAWAHAHAVMAHVVMPPPLVPLGCCIAITG